jgi:hypothetical protein
MKDKVCARKGKIQANLVVRLCNKSKRYFQRELFSESKIEEGGTGQKMT